MTTSIFAREPNSKFVEIGSDKPIFVHRKGSNVIHGYYYYDYNDDKLLEHYHGKLIVNIDQLRHEYETVKKMTIEEATEGSILLQGRHTGS